VDADGYRDLAAKTVIELLEVEHAVIWTEVEARLADRRWGPTSVRIDPHHLTTARRLLIDEGLLIPTADQTRGGRIIETHSLAGAPKREVERAASRKRLLHARFLGWAKGTRRHPRGLIGGAGEAVTSASLGAATGAGYRLVPHSGGDVAQLFGEDVPGGSLDEAAHLIVMDGDIPSGVVSVLIEVKNIREWIYPTSSEMYQLLAKATLLQHSHPDRAFLPVLVCRRAHKTTFVMAKLSGFYVIDAHRQFITPTADITDEALIEVRSGLGFIDLILSVGPDALVAKHFQHHLPPVAAAFASRWKETAEALGHHFQPLRNPGLDAPDRARLMRVLRRESKTVHGSGGW
jgi:hypothetical protein